MTAQTLRYRKPDGSTGTAYVFLDDDGLVMREKDLCEMAAAVRTAPARPTAEDVKAFLDLRQPCPNPYWEDLRKQFAVELGAAETSGCSKCERAAISRKYAKTLVDL